jgi:pimeloyl-ACP methyl ester carboxylesterase
MMTSARAPIFLLVHGTFASGATWTLQDSPFCAALCWAFPGASVRSFEWSGKNSFKARANATHALRATLKKYLAAEADSAFVLIGHSHGGTVALQSLRGLEHESRILGIVCLSTPFFHVRLRGLNPDDIATPLTALVSIVTYLILFSIPSLILASTTYTYVLVFLLWHIFRRRKAVEPANWRSEVRQHWSEFSRQWSSLARQWIVLPTICLIVFLRGAHSWRIVIAGWG